VALGVVRKWPVPLDPSTSVLATIAEETKKRILPVDAARGHGDAGPSHNNTASYNNTKATRPAPQLTSAEQINAAISQYLEKAAQSGPSAAFTDPQAARAYYEGFQAGQRFERANALRAWPNGEGGLERSRSPRRPRNAHESSDRYRPSYRDRSEEYGRLKYE